MTAPSRCTIIAGIVFLAASAWGQPAASDLDTLSARLYAEFQGSGGSAATIRQWLDSLRPDGAWPDINYADTGRAVWAPSTHVSRMLSMAQAFRNPAHALHDSASVKNGFLGAFDGWIRLDPQSPNWWWNQIGTQLSLGPAMLLMKDQLSPARRDSGDVIMARSWAVHATMTGENLVWVSKITIWRGCIMDTASLVADAVNAITAGIAITTQPSDGVQRDWSFHQHGPQLYSGGYGMGFSSDGSDVAQLCRTTQFAFPGAKLDIMTGYILDGQQWMVRGTTMDHSVCGREITRPNSPNKKNAFVAVCRNMQLATTARAREYAAFSSRINTWPVSLSAALNGNIHFWCSDYMAHHRTGYLASIKMSSKRTRGAELVNGEGLKSYYLGDGVIFFYRSGNEYYNIFPVWDWARLPGVTCPHDTAPPAMPSSYTGATDFVGGVSDGMRGVTGFDYSRNGVTGRKALFCFDREVVALGAGITGTGKPPVFTSVNQCLLRGAVTVSAGGVRSTPGPGTHRFGGVSWVHHDSIGYVPLRGDSLTVRNDTQSGSWKSINSTGSATRITDTVFGLWVDHGVAPSGAGYAYAVVPGVSADGLDAYVKSTRRCRVAANTVSLQAVRDDSGGVGGEVFYAAGSVTLTDSFTVGADRPCIAMERETGDSVIVAVANPLNAACTVHVSISPDVRGADAVRDTQTSTTMVTFMLPGGLDAGRSVVKGFRRAGAGVTVAPALLRGMMPLVWAARNGVIVNPGHGMRSGTANVYSASGRLVAAHSLAGPDPIVISLRRQSAGLLLVQVGGDAAGGTWIVPCPR